MSAARSCIHGMTSMTSHMGTVHRGESHPLLYVPVSLPLEAYGDELLSFLG